MTSSALFYWLGWILWIIVTFFRRKDKKRTLFACWVLLSIIGSNLYITIENLSISVSFLLVLFGSILLLIQLSGLMYHLFSAFTITIGYAAILFWEKNSPVWIIFPSPLLLSFIVVMLIIILTKSFEHRLGIGLLGVSSGELIYSLTLASYGFYESIGQHSFLENIVLTIVIITFLDILRKWKYKLFLRIQNYKQSPEVAK